MLTALTLIGAAIMLAHTPAYAETLAERAERLEEHFTLNVPEGEGPFPVVIMLHGCGGRRGFLDSYAEAAREAGAASVIVDSFAARGWSRMRALLCVCSGLVLRGAERAGDLYATAAWAREQEWADGARLIAAGWSHGGWSVLDALALAPGEEMARATGLTDLPSEPLEGLAGVFLAYPYAGFASLAGKRPWRLDVEALAIMPGRDHIVGTRAPRAALERQRALGARIDFHDFPEATHAFDEPRSHHPRVRYSAHDSAHAEALLAEMIGRVGAKEE